MTRFSRRRSQAASVLATYLLFVTCVTTMTTSGAFSETAIDPCSTASFDRRECREDKVLHAAEQLNILTERGVTYSLIGTIALVTTVILSAFATFAAVRAAKASLLAVDHAKSATEKELRPYLMGKFRPESRPNAKNKGCLEYGISLCFINIGKTPATDCVVYARLELFNDVDHIPSDFDFPTIGEPLFEGVMMQNDFSIIDFGGTLKEDLLRASFNRKTLMLMYGWAEYSQSGSVERYRTEFSAQIDVIGSPTSGQNNIFSPRNIGVFNGLDQGCSRPPQKFEAKKYMTPPRPKDNVTMH